MKTSPEEYPTWFSANSIKIDDVSNLKDIQYKYFVYHDDIFTDFDVSIKKLLTIFKEKKYYMGTKFICEYYQQNLRKF